MGALTPEQALRLPSIEQIESDADDLRAELEAVLGAARDVLARVQDADAEWGDELGRAWVVRVNARDELRTIREALARAHAYLVLPADPRAAAARRRVAE